MVGATDSELGESPTHGLHKSRNGFELGRAVIHKGTKSGAQNPGGKMGNGFGTRSRSHPLGPKSGTQNPESKIRGQNPGAKSGTRSDSDARGGRSRGQNSEGKIRATDPELGHAVTHGGQNQGAKSEQRISNSLTQSPTRLKILGNSNPANGSRALSRSHPSY